MKHLYFASSFNPLCNADISFLEDPHLYFPQIEKDSLVFFVLLPSLTDNEIRKKMILAYYPKASFLPYGAFVQKLKEKSDDYFVIPHYLLSIHPELSFASSLLLQLVDFHSLEKNQSSLRYQGEREESDTRNGSYLRTKKEVLDVLSEEALYFVQDVKQAVSPHRFLHSLSVAKTAYTMGKNALLNPILCYHAGLLHDIAKDYPDEEAKQIVEKNFSMYSPCPKFALHQFVGAYLAKNKYRVPSDVVDSIEFHCTGKAEMSLYMKCLYAADEVEPLREFETAEKRRRCFENLEEGFLYLVKKQVEYFQQKGIDYNEYFLCKEKYDYYLNLTEDKKC